MPIFAASPIIPFLNYLMGPLFAEAGLPEGCLQVVQFAPGTDGQLMEQAIAHPDVRVR
jgi:acyl-CoA reductase-like NAD-dependent aldehyde dehydrogenase